MESNNATCCDGNGFSSLGVSAGTLRFLAQVKVAKAGEFYPITTFEGQTCLIEKGLDHIRGFTFVQANFFKKKVGEVGLGQCHTVALTWAPGFLPGDLGGMNVAGRH